jgi:OmpA-OmpF porin, OOP family
VRLFKVLTCMQTRAAWVAGCTTHHFSETCTGETRTNMRLASRWICGTTAACALLGAAPALGQERAGGFTLNRFEPSERGSDWFAAESLDLRGHQRFAAGLVIDYARKPLVMYDPAGDEQVAIVSDQLYAHAGGAVVLWDRLRLGLNIPVAVYQAGEAGQSGNTVFESSGATALGDIRLTGDVRILGEYRDPFSLAAGLRLYAPTGSQEAYTGEGAFRAAARVIGAGRVSAFVYSGSLGFDFRGRDDAFADSARGSEVNFTAAAGALLLDDRLVVGPEVFGATVVTASDAFFARTTTPIEAILGGHYRFHNAWDAGLGFGPGLTRGFGTPQFRVLASLTWFEPHERPPEPPPPLTPSDRDGDGIIDSLDACPDEPGVPSDDPDKHGCPPPSDRDGDGIIDEQDACPDEPGVPSDDPDKHGCPPPGDRDGDGILDPEDACPDEPGLPTDDPATHGCPSPDRDGDGILNEVDACPDVAGEPNEDPKKHGCPAARVEKDRIVIREQVQFAYNSDVILKASDALLEAVAKILIDNPQIKKVSIEGHTDDRGGAQFNQRLSERRAASVVKGLIKNGVDKDRLTSIGYGKDQPIADNKTEEGRTENRRVEIHIIQ